jgi:YD repeat-containing protein
VFFPHVTEIEAREHSASASPDRIERTILEDYDAHGNPGTRRRNSFFEGDPAGDHISAVELFTYSDNEADWLIKLPVRLELRDGSGTPHAVRVTTYDGAPFVGLPEGQTSAGLATRTTEMKLRTAALPADWLGGRDLTALGYEALGSGDTAGFYAPTASLERDGRGNVIGQSDALGNTLQIDYDADGVYPLRTSDALGRETQLTFEPRAGEPSQIVMPDGRIIRYRHDALGRLVGQVETDNAGVEQLVKAWIVDTASVPTSLTSIAPDSAGQDFLTLVTATRERSSTRSV